MNYVLKIFSISSIFFLIFASLASICLAEVSPKLVVLGDSYSDEYKYYPPDRSKAKNWVEILSSERHIDFGEESNVSRGAPRNQGFANNWALDGATSSDLVKSQLPGAVSQVAAGNIDAAVIFVGGNDFLKLLVIDASPLSYANLISNNVRVAVSQILSANPNVKIVVGTVPYVRFLPVIQAALKKGQLDNQDLDNLTNAFSLLNSRIRSIAAKNPERVAVFDLADSASRVLRNNTYKVGSLRVSTRVPGDRATSFFLLDGIHPGTVGQALVANSILRALHHFGIARSATTFGTDEILKLIGK